MPERDSEREAARLDHEAWLAWHRGDRNQDAELAEKARAMRERLTKKGEADNGNA